MVGFDPTIFVALEAEKSPSVPSNARWSTPCRNSRRRGRRLATRCSATVPRCTPSRSGRRMIVVRPALRSSSYTAPSDPRSPRAHRNWEGVDRKALVAWQRREERRQRLVQALAVELKRSLTREDLRPIADLAHRFEPEPLVPDRRTWSLRRTTQRADCIDLLVAKSSAVVSDEQSRIGEYEARTTANPGVERRVVRVLQ